MTNFTGIGRSGEGCRRWLPAAFHGTRQFQTWSVSDSDHIHAGVVGVIA